MTLPLTFLAWESACEQYSRTFSPCVSFHPAKEEAFHTRQILWFLSFMLLLHVCSSKKAAIGNKIHSQWEQRMERMETTRFHSFTWGGGHSSARCGSSEKKNAGVLGLSCHTHTLSPSLAAGELHAICRNSLTSTARFSRNLHAKGSITTKARL